MGKKAKKRPSNLQMKKPQEYSKAQKMYMKLCSNSKVRPDTEFVNHLPDQVLYFPNLDNAGEKELDIVGIDKSYDKDEAYQVWLHRA